MKNRLLHLLNYALFRGIGTPLSFLPYSWLRVLGRGLGSACFFLYPRFRKRALSNLALASDLSLSSTQVRILAKESMRNLGMTALEYFRLARKPSIDTLATCENPHVATDILASGKGVIFFCGHQANWEILFLDGSRRMPGVAIGRPIANRHLYRWITSMRQAYGGTLITPKHALREGLRALKQGKFLGIVGDQGMPEQGIPLPFLGRRAWTSPLPAILSLRSGCPIIVATIRRESAGFKIRYSDPIWPRGDVASIMSSVLSLFEASVRSRPEEWLWIHNRWKQQPSGKIRRELRHDAIAVVVPKNTDTMRLTTLLRTLYPTEFITLFVPAGTAVPSGIEIATYRDVSDLLQPDYRFKLILDLTQDPRIQSHFLSLSALRVLSFGSIEEFEGYARYK
jgi:KDO2-lipid IV(A) lauroyltransferase